MFALYVERPTTRGKKMNLLEVEGFLQELQGLVGKTQKEYPRWRKGQTVFNVLLDLRPDMAERIRGTELDPFHRDEVVPKLLDWLKEQLTDG